MHVSASLLELFLDIIFFIKVCIWFPVMKDLYLFIPVLKDLCVFILT
jgi:hypothetical protein